MELMDDLGSRGIPFLFVISFDGSEVYVWQREEVPESVRFAVPMCNGCGSFEKYEGGEVTFGMNPVSPERYGAAFDKVLYHLRRGDTYLINLTMPTEIEAPLSLSQIYRYSNAPYRLLFDGRFVCFSPEIFVRITDGIISSYPMKGTIDASVPAAEEKIVSDGKEFAEHNTIVDLIRNDLSMVATEVRVKRYRYIDRIETNRGALLQVSSEISGKLMEELKGKPGTVMATLLPAGSVTGAPKERTVEILKEAEGYD
ncbi:MAG: aminodeoxychorismate synthase component I, partial [Bacteroidales bacterium]|nr:aminodeoxychorismate synthase component I [Bacteroidales bacterium]